MRGLCSILVGLENPSCCRVSCAGSPCCTIIGPLASSKGPEHIRSSCVSPCGGWIAYSIASRFYLHRVQLVSDQISINRVSGISMVWGELWVFSQLATFPDSLWWAQPLASILVCFLQGSQDSQAERLSPPPPFFRRLHQPFSGIGSGLRACAFALAVRDL